MSSDRDTTRIVRSWLEDGVTQLPDRVLDAVLDQVPATRQRRANWPALRFPIMNSTSVRYGFAAVAILIITIRRHGVLYAQRELRRTSSIADSKPDAPSGGRAARARDVHDRSSLARAGHVRGWAGVDVRPIQRG